MNVVMMRSEIIKAYPGEIWKKKVKNMPENQVIAIYNNLQKANHLKPRTLKEASENKFSQLTFDDIFREI